MSDMLEFLDVQRKLRDTDQLCELLRKSNVALTIQNKQLEAENAALRERTRWIPVSERLPDENVAVLAVVSSAFSDFRYIQIAHHVPSVPQWNTEDGVHFHGTEYQRIAHWMPLPEAPKEDE